MPAGGRVAAGGAQALGLAVGEVLMTWYGQCGSGAVDAGVVVLQGVARVAVVLPGWCDFNARAQGQAWGPGTVQVVLCFLSVISWQNFCLVFNVGATTGLDSIRGDLLQGEGLLRLGTEDFVRRKIWVICTEDGKCISQFGFPVLQSQAVMTHSKVSAFSA